MLYLKHLKILEYQNSYSFTRNSGVVCSTMIPYKGPPACDYYSKLKGKVFGCNFDQALASCLSIAKSHSNVMFFFWYNSSSSLAELPLLNHATPVMRGDCHLIFYLFPISQLFDFLFFHCTTLFYCKNRQCCSFFF